MLQLQNSFHQKIAPFYLYIKLIFNFFPHIFHFIMAWCPCPMKMFTTPWGFLEYQHSLLNNLSVAKKHNQTKKTQHHPSPPLPPPKKTKPNKPKQKPGHWLILELQTEIWSGLNFSPSTTYCICGNSSNSWRTCGISQQC